MGEDKCSKVVPVCQDLFLKSVIIYFVVCPNLKSFTVSLCLPPSFVFASLTGTSGELKPFCMDGYCIFIKDGAIRAEAGLCAIIPCSFSTASGFKTSSIVWSKCNMSERCGDSDVVIHAKSNKIQPGVKRMSLLDPNLDLKNCSILINDLTASDAGSYELRISGLLNGKTDGCTFFRRANLYVQGTKSYNIYI